MGLWWCTLRSRDTHNVSNTVPYSQNSWYRIFTDLIFDIKLIQKIWSINCPLCSFWLERKTNCAICHIRKPYIVCTGCYALEKSPHFPSSNNRIRHSRHSMASFRTVVFGSEKSLDGSELLIINPVQWRPFAKMWAKPALFHYDHSNQCHKVR